MKLHYQIVGSGRPLVILHGLFGSSDNWRGLAKQLAKWVQVITVDLRNHGYSPHSQNQNYQLMTDDLAELFDELNLQNVDIIGHSVGGKVAMAFAQRYQNHVNKLVVVDIAPRQYKNEHQQIFEALLAVDLTLYLKRTEVDEVLTKTLPDRAVRQFLLMNLELENEKLTWKINLPALFENYPQFLEPVCLDDEITVSSCFIRGARSSYVQDDDKVLIRTTFPNSEICTIDQAGHWVHAEAPQQFLAKVTEFFNYD
ncbi:MAG: alpha/beta hydrolase [Gammaproteobacteria bacterium]|nr:MAG: alpha/beta hydrolase [Gammaproteobacteria bacterium]